MAPRHGKEKFQRALEMIQYIDYAAGASVHEQALYEDAVRTAAKEVQPAVVSAILANWKATGLGHGDSAESVMAKNIRNITVAVESKQGKARLVYAFPKLGEVANYKMDEYKSKEKQWGRSKQTRSAYVVAGALNFGSVRFSGPGWALREKRNVQGDYFGKTRTPVGAKAKRTIKKVVLTGTASARAVEAVRSGYSARTTASITQAKRKRNVPVALGLRGVNTIFAREGAAGLTVHTNNGIRVTQGKEFWKLTTAQENDISAAFMEAFRKARMG